MIAWRRSSGANACGGASEVASFAVGASSTIRRGDLPFRRPDFSARSADRRRAGRGQCPWLSRNRPESTGVLCGLLVPRCPRPAPRRSAAPWPRPGNRRERALESRQGVGIASGVGSLRGSATARRRAVGPVGGTVRPASPRCPSGAKFVSRGPRSDRAESPQNRTSPPRNSNNCSTGSGERSP